MEPVSYLHNHLTNNVGSKYDLFETVFINQYTEFNDQKRQDIVSEVIPLISNTKIHKILRDSINTPEKLNELTREKLNKY
jgi:hypothetical protein